MYTIEASVPSLRAKNRLTRLLSTGEIATKTDAKFLLTTTAKTSSLGGRTSVVLFSGDVSSSLSLSKIHLRSDFRAGQKLPITLFLFSHHFVIGTSLSTSRNTKVQKGVSLLRLENELIRNGGSSLGVGALA